MLELKKINFEDIGIELVYDELDVVKELSFNNNQYASDFFFNLKKLISKNFLEEDLFYLFSNYDIDKKVAKVILKIVLTYFEKKN